MLRETRDIRVFPMERQQFRAFQRQVGKLGLPYASIRDKGRKVRWWMCCFPQRSWTGPTRSLRRSAMWEPNKRHRNRSKWQNEKTDLGRGPAGAIQSPKRFPETGLPQGRMRLFPWKPVWKPIGCSSHRNGFRPTNGRPCRTSAWRIRNRGRTPNNA